MSMLVVTIPGRPPMPNTNAKRGWQSAMKHNAHWKGVAAAAADDAVDRQHAGVWAPLKRASLHIRFIVPTKARRDLDNLIASIKPLTDGLVAARILEDDSTDVVSEMLFAWDYQKGITATVYIIRDTSDE
jgi:Holliday junction resolvase RusA-like endonuclease